ncbi:MAG: hypothetical protein B7Y41_00235 [Hydrogenophilales bacterium 28-61-23]|nr:MAG: hypothetical protein B7Y41_00235 [Hydrogenophilales bacterium 28-61-23]
MSIRFIAGLAAVLVLAFSGSSLAQEPASLRELKQLQVLLAVINSELKSDLDQILVLQEAIKANARPLLEAQGRTPDPVSFDAVAASQRLAIQRETALNARLDALLARSAALDAKKLPILDRMREIGLAPQR